jgi:sulfide dehydrogenase cytochrome subunit
MSRPYPKPRPQSGTTLVVLVGAGPGSPKNADAFFGAAPQTRPRSAFTVCEVDPSLTVRTLIAQLMTAILSQRACGTRAGFKPAPTSFATAMCFPSGVCAVLVALCFAAHCADAPPGASSCSGCHPATRWVDTTVPRLAGRNPADIISAMQGFKSGKLPATVMDRIARGFSDEEIKAIAAWYGAQRE